MLAVRFCGAIAWVVSRKLCFRIEGVFLPQDLPVGFFVFAQEEIQGPGPAVLGQGGGKGQNDSFERILGEPGLDLFAKHSASLRGIASPSRNDQQTTAPQKVLAAAKFEEFEFCPVGIGAVEVQMGFVTYLACFEFAHRALVQPSDMAFDKFGGVFEFKFYLAVDQVPEVGLGIIF